MRKITTVSFIVLFVYCSLTLAISLPLPYKDIDVVNDNGHARFSYYETRTDGCTPDLPGYIVRFLVPPEADFNTISVTITDIQEQMIPGTYEIEPVVPAMAAGGYISWPQDRKIVNGRDVSIYETNAFYPPRYQDLRTVGKFWDFKIVIIAIFPYKYNPVTKQLMKLTSGKLVVDYKRLDNRPALDYPNPEYVKEAVRNLTINYNEMASCYGETVLSNPRKADCFLIVTTKDIQQNVENFNDFVQTKKKAFAVTVVNEDQWGGGTGDDAAENLRKYLKNNYQKLNIKYVLLIGDPLPDGTGIGPGKGTLAMKNTKPRKNTGFDQDWCPTDFYFSDLSGDWDKNNNKIYGEWKGDWNVDGGCDQYAEVHVGRIYTYSKKYDEIAAVLDKTMKYLNESDISWRKNIFMTAEKYDANNKVYDVMEEIKTKACEKNSWKYYRVYEKDYGVNPEKVGIGYKNVTNAWKSQPFGMCSWGAHGQYNFAQNIIDDKNAKTLSNDHPTIVFMGSCLCSKVEMSNNLGYTLMKHGGIAVVGGTRVTWYDNVQKPPYETSTWPSDQSFIYRFTAFQINDTKKDPSLALDVDCRSFFDWKYDSGNFIPNMYAYVIYGDPSVCAYGVSTTSIVSQTPSNSTVHKTNITHAHSTIVFHYTGLDAKQISLALYDLRGRIITGVTDKIASTAGAYTWNYHSALNRTLSKGMYVVAVRLHHSEGQHSASYVAPILIK